MCVRVYVCMCVQANMCHGVHVYVRQQLSAVKCLLPSCLNRASSVSATPHIPGMLACEVLYDDLLSPPPNYHGNARMMDGCHHIHVLRRFGRPKLRLSGFCHVYIYPMSHFIVPDMIFLKQYVVYIHAHMTDEGGTHIGSVHAGSR